MHDPHWLQLIDRVRADTPRLLADFIEELQAHDGYVGEVALEDIERTARSAFSLFAARLAGDAGADAPSDFAAALGQRRARQGVRVERFMEAVRINFRVLWRALERAARPDLTDALLSHGAHVLDVIERYATEVQRAFLAEAEAMERQHRTASERARSRLFGGLADADELDRIAEMLRLLPSVDYELLVTSDARNDLRHDVMQSGGQVYEDGDCTVLLRPRRGPVDWIDAHSGQSGGYIARVRGLSEVGRATTLARGLAARSGSGPALRLRDGFSAFVRDTTRETLRGFEHELLGSFAELTDDEQSRYFETLRTYIHTGSMQRTGELLFLHRNTVLKRLRAFEQVSGLDVTVPRDAAIALVLLDL